MNAQATPLTSGPASAGSQLPTAADYLRAPADFLTLAKFLRASLDEQFNIIDHLPPVDARALTADCENSPDFFALQGPHLRQVWTRLLGRGWPDDQPLIDFVHAPFDAQLALINGLTPQRAQKLVDRCAM